MSLELFNPTTLISRKYSRQFMEKAFELARFNGWRPMGTLPPADHDFHLLNADWFGTYRSNDGQTVSSEDAFLLAYALKKSLDDIPEVTPEIDWNPKLWFMDDFPEWLTSEEKEMIEDGLEEHSPDVMEIHPFEFFAGDEKHHLTELELSAAV